MVHFYDSNTETEKNQQHGQFSASILSAEHEGLCFWKQ